MEIAGTYRKMTIQYGNNFMSQTGAAAGERSGKL
jgi:hypothetical protein